MLARARRPVAPRLTLAPSGVTGHVSIDLAHPELLGLGSLRDLLPMPNGLSIDGGTGRASLHADVDLGSGSTRGDGEVIGRPIRQLSCQACRSAARGKDRSGLPLAISATWRAPGAVTVGVTGGR
jgi:hypothetical protein